MTLLFPDRDGEDLSKTTINPVVTGDGLEREVEIMGVSAKGKTYSVMLTMSELKAMIECPPAIKTGESK